MQREDVTGPTLLSVRLATRAERFARKRNHHWPLRPCAKSVPPSSRPRHVQTLAFPSTEQYGDSRRVGSSQAGGVSFGASVSILGYGRSPMSSCVRPGRGRLRRFRFQRSGKSPCRSAVDHNAASKPDSDGWTNRDLCSASDRFDPAELRVAEEWGGHTRRNSVNLHHTSGQHIRQQLPIPGEDQQSVGNRDQRYGHAHSKCRHLAIASHHLATS